MTPAPRAGKPRPAGRRAPPSAAAELPPVRVVILNYNGAGFIEPCLAAALQTDYPHVELVVVDNASTDGSPDSVRREFPQVTLVEAGANIGFARGNNLALRGAQCPYVALLNPDTRVSPDWLRPLVERLQADPLTAGVGPKILFDRDRVAVRLTSETFRPHGADARELGARVYAARLAPPARAGAVAFNQGVFGLETDSAGRPFRWMSGRAELAVPVAEGPTRLELEMSAGDGRCAVPFEAAVDGTPLLRTRLNAPNTSIEIEIPASLAARARRPVVENAGIAPLPDGSMRDRGTRVSQGNVWHEWDGGPFDRPGEVFAVKGGAALYRSAMLESLDYLDPGFFMYYEDADLCWRARRRGWRFWYEPAAVVRHSRAALSGEWSPAFIRNVESGMLRMLGKNAPLAWMGRQALRAARESVDGLLQAGGARLRGQPADSGAAAARAAALARVGRQWSDIRRLRRVERELAPLDGRELVPFVEAP